MKLILSVIPIYLIFTSFLMYLDIFRPMKM
jgi:hypothetical protein